MEHNEQFNQQNTQETSSSTVNFTMEEEGTSSHKKPSNFLKRHKNAVLIAGCMLLSLSSGFAGAYILLNSGQENKQTVLYRSVNTTPKKEIEGGVVSVKNIADATMDSVVEIQTEAISTHSFFQQAIVSGAGSGVILSKDGYIVTNHHVIDGATKITVTTRDSKTFDAKLVGSDAATDLAVLKVEADNLKPAVLGTSKNLAVGDIAVAIGNPLGSLGGTVTSGIISALDRELTIDNQKMHLLQTNAAINPGNSGGGLFNQKGELIGVVNAKSSGESIEGLGFAIPIDRALPIIENLMSHGYVKDRPALGVTLAKGETNSPFAQSTQIFIYEVQEGSAAEKAGLQRGDQILKIDNKEIREISDVTTIISSHKVNDKIKMLILRDNSAKTIEVTLGQAIQNPQTQQQSER